MAEQKKKNGARTAYLITVAVLCAAAAIVTIPNALASRKNNTQNARDAVTSTTAEPPATANPVVPGIQDSASPGRDSDDSARPETVRVPAAVADNDDGGAAEVNEPAESEAAAEEVSSTPAIPLLIAPLSGSVSKAHSGDMLVYSSTMNDYRTHTGIDIEAAAGTPVYAAGDGVIGEIWVDPMMGQCVSIIHAGGFTSFYKNLDPASVSNITAGQNVSAGDCIGAVGDSAIIEVASEPHLHFELSASGAPVDPCEYIDFTANEYYDE